MKTAYDYATHQVLTRALWIPLVCLVMSSCDELSLQPEGGDKQSIQLETSHNKGDRPTKEWCEDAGFRNYGQCVKEWAQGNLDPNPENIIWDGGYDPAMHFSDDEHGSFKAYHRVSTTNEVIFNQIGHYGKPIQYGNQLPNHVGDGSLLSLVATTERTITDIHFPEGPTRCGEYAAKFTVKNSANGTEQDLDGDPAGRGDDCDPSNGDCSRRRGEVHLQQAINDMYGGLLYGEESWISNSVYLPPDWSEGGSGWGVIIFQLKPYSGKGSPFVSIAVEGDVWKIWHRWGEGSDTTVNPEWQYQMFYTGDEDGSPYPREDFWPEGLADFPDVAASHAALQSVNRGGWTDWIIHVLPDYRGEGAGGQGLLDIWKREDSGPWVKVLEIRPLDGMQRGGETFDRGIGYNHPNGYGPKNGMYMHKNRVWGESNNRVLYNDCMKVGNENATFVDMSPDGSMP